jgi:pimeloyl-ACP methyl ester carboxylesterase
VAAIHAAAKSADVRMVVLDSPYADVEETVRRAVEYGASKDEAAKLEPGLRRRLWLLAHVPGLVPATEAMYRLRTGSALEPEDMRIRGVLGKVRSPYVLMLLSEHDPIVPEEVGRQMIHLIPTPHRRLVLMKGSGHSALNEEVSKYAAIVVACLNEAFPVPPAPL